MSPEVAASPEERLLLIDTCGEVGSVALAEGGRVVACEAMVRQRASAEIVGVVERLLSAAGWKVGELSGVGGVSGPGSFTGVRTGLAVAKGLSEAASLPLVAVSRLAVLARAGGEQAGFAVLDAGRGEVYVRDAQDGREFLCADAVLLELAIGKSLVFADAALAARLATATATLVMLDAGAALPLLIEQLRSGVGDAALLDAHYLRDESSIYAKPSGNGGLR